MAEGSMTAGTLREGLVSAMDLGGAFGANLHESKEVLVRVGDVEGKHHYLTVEHVAVAFVGGRFVFVVQAAGQQVEERLSEASDREAAELLREVIAEIADVLPSDGPALDMMTRRIQKILDRYEGKES